MAPFLAISCSPGTGIPGGGAADPWRAQLTKYGRGRSAGRSAGAHSTITCQLGTRQGLNLSFPVSFLTRGIGQRPEQVQPQNVSSGFNLRN